MDAMGTPRKNLRERFGHSPIANTSSSPAQALKAKKLRVLDLFSGAGGADSAEKEPE